MTEIVKAGQPVPRAEVVPVPFLDGAIPCAMVDGEPMVILKPIAELLGLRWQAQHAKLSADESACITFIVTQMPGDDQARKVMTVSLETFAIWLATIQPSRVRVEARDAVKRYKREAARVLREHFFGQPKQELTKAEWIRQALAIEEERERLAAANAELEAEVAEMAPKVDEYEQVVEARGLIPLSVFAQQSQIVRPTGQLLGERTAIAALQEIGVLKDAPGTEHHLTPYQDHAHRIQTKRERRGPVWVNVPYVQPRHFGYLVRRINEHFYPGRERLPRQRYSGLRAIEGGASKPRLTP